MNRWPFGDQKNFSYKYLSKILRGLGYDNINVRTKIPYRDMPVVRIFDYLFKKLIKYWGHYLYIVSEKVDIDAEYQNSFGLFLSHTDEKQVIANKLEMELRSASIESCLDIGGGNGSLSCVICDKDRVTIVEPNRHFVQTLRGQGFNCICSKWENAIINRKFDLVLAAYTITYLPQDSLKELVQKMMGCLNPGGRLVILAVDENDGSWREIHTYFYSLIGLKKMSSTVRLKKIMSELGAESSRFTTKVYADDIDQMLEILTFDFCRFGQQFEDNRQPLREQLEIYSNGNGIELDMVHWMFTLRK